MYWLKHLENTGFNFFNTIDCISYPKSLLWQDFKAFFIRNILFLNYFMILFRKVQLYICLF